MIRYAILLIIFGAGIWAIAFSFSPLENKKDSESWERANAVIRSSDVEKFERKEKKPGDSYAKTKITYKPKITYSYRVEENEYTGDRIDFSNLSYSDLQKAKEVLQTYTIGKEIEIFYNPLVPAEAVITRDAQAIIPLTYFGILLSCWSVWCIVKPFIRKKA